MLQYKIPQNIGIEDKIVGPFSLRQLIILAIGGGISYVIFAITSKLYELNFIEYFVMALPAVFALLLAVVKIHNVSFGKYILLVLEFALKPKKRMWDHRGIVNLVDPDLTDKTAAKKMAAATEEDTKKDVNVSDLSSVLDSGGFEHVQKVQHKDIDEATDDDLITEAYFGHKREQSQTENMYWRTKDMQKKKLDLLAKVPAAKKAEPVTATAVQTAPATPVPAVTGPVCPKCSNPLGPNPGEFCPVCNHKLTAAPEKKESVVENLANVIKEAKENNQAKKEVAPVAAPVAPATTVPAPAAPVAATPTTEIPQAPATPQTEKKRRPRSRKPKVAQPVRKNTQVDTTDKTAPVKLIKKTSKQEETSLGDLKEGGEIEFNLE